MSSSFSISTETEQWCRTTKIPVEAHLKTASTNDLAKREAMQISEPLKIYIADQQTAGRGRNTASWNNAAPGGALLCTWSFSCSQHPQAITGPLMGLALYSALKNTFDLQNLSIKPPNDIYLKDKKILGLLVETVQAGDKTRLIVGFGLNVFSCPANLNIAGYLTTQCAVTTAAWLKFLTATHDHLANSARAAMATHLTLTQREELLTALNNNPHLADKFTSVSPFGDLSQKDNTISWRDL